MIYGIDTDFLVAVEIREHPFHEAADRLLTQLLEEGDEIAVAPQTLAEFVHVVTDPRRMQSPLDMAEAIHRAGVWWRAREVVRVFPDGTGVERFFGWLGEFRLGRKRLLDTMLAATFASNGIRKIITNNGADYRAFGVFEVVPYCGAS